MGLLGSIFELSQHGVDCLDPEYVDLAQLRFRPGRAFVLHVAVGVDQNGAAGIPTQHIARHLRERRRDHSYDLRCFSEVVATTSSYHEASNVLTDLNFSRLIGHRKLAGPYFETAMAWWAQLLQQTHTVVLRLR